ncbi:PREDICTED: myrosinase-binding protein 2-like isoform X2 [Tarenaya hassleriana]|uniref:myrosinase-binding protein 2-like isoform X2 n=1 Tax=Tarenaya hassleriana TaxID=28532 RepID=UPI0008FD031E|nr:PREDICTED: myrosinase-binding protein 2-like isoform X2 [Tarenaya hassleriana]
MSGNGADSSVSSSFVRLPLMGGNGGSAWDDGVHDRLSKVYVGKGKSCVVYIEFVYDKNGKATAHGHGHKPDELEEFVLATNEYITSVEGSISYVDQYGRSLVTSLAFKTSTGKTSKAFGYVSDNKFVVENNGRELVGFHGRSGEALDAIGAYSSTLSPSTKLSAQGGPGGDTWDHGVHGTLRKIYVGNGNSCVGYIKFVYDIGGKEEIQERGIKTNEPKMFALDAYEYITSVEGTVSHIAQYGNRLVTSLTFKTSKDRTSPTFGFATGQRFVLEDKGRVVVGFHGRSGDAIDALGAYFSISPSPTKLQAIGGYGGDPWDHGAYNTLRKVYVGNGNSCVGYIGFVFENSGKQEIREHGIKPKELKEFVLDPYEYITSVEGTVSHIAQYGNRLVTSLTFKTSKDRTSPTFGFATGQRFVLEDKGRVVVGFHGRSGDAIDALGAYFSISPSPTKLQAIGGYGGDPWDHGAYNTLRKVYVGNGNSCVGYIGFVFENSGKQEIREHGIKPKELKEFVLDPYEHITSVEGTYGYITQYANHLVTSLTFKTSKGRTSPAFGFVTGTRFVLENKGHVLVTFHGRSGDAIDALGAYFSILPSHVIRFPALGGNGGNAWDDGGYNRIRKVYVGKGMQCIGYVNFVYDKGGELDPHEHGTKRDKPEELVLDPDEYITSVEGTYGLVRAYNARLVTSLTFKTSKGRTSPTFGVVNNSRFVFENDGREIVGFHGRGNEAIDALGAYEFKLVYFAPARKLRPCGGNGGTAWDDGAHGGVRRIYVGQGDSGVVFVKFVYDKGEKMVAGNDHGKKTILGTEEFVLDYPDEYITSVKGRYDKIYGKRAEIITMLRFKTNKRRSPPFGLDAGTEFVLEEKGSKIVGFHGKASDVVHQVGVHVLPISN